MKYYNERKAASANASEKAINAKSKASELDGKRKTLADAEKKKQNNVDGLRNDVKQAEQQAAEAMAESKIADEKDHFIHAAVRDREQKEAYDQASENAKNAFETAKTVYEAAKASKPTNESSPVPNKSEEASAELNVLKKAMDEAQTAADKAKANAEPSFMMKTLNGLAEWWTGGKTQMGMAHFV
jgi:hypothetical protein